MVENRTCSFCGSAIEPGTGKMYVKKDGTVFTFCSNKCKKNNIGLGRVSRRTKWTSRYAEMKASTLDRETDKTAEKPAEEEKPAEKPKKPAKKAEKAEAKAPAKPRKPAKKEEKEETPK